MSSRHRVAFWMFVAAGAVAGVRAQEPTPPPATAQTPGAQIPSPESIEPAVETSRGADAGASAQAAAPVPAARTAPANATPQPGGTKRVMDRIELDTTQITGNRELPKVLYIVPWKQSDLGDLLGRPANSLLDEVLAPVDRDVFRRQNRYYDALAPDGAVRADKAEK
ncbi:MAG: hypothetical protein AB7G76_13185 [Steroidobacteraceae bacterium]